MIDWINAKLPCTNTLNTGCIAKIDAEGEVEWVNDSWMPVTGSYDANIRIKPLTPQTIMFMGNPTKFLQGHNLFGINDPIRLMWLCYKSICDKLYDAGLTPTLQDLDWVKRGYYTVSRVDINETWFLKTKEDVLAWIRSAGDKVSMPYRGRGVYSGDTLYWGKGSKYYFLKAYSKGDEINSKKSNFPDDLRTPQMLEYADRALRVELQLCSKALREWDINYLCKWTPELPRMLLMKQIRGLEMSNNFKLSNDVVKSLPSRLRLAYLGWLNGEDLRAILPKNTFYRYRRKLKEYDIDISMVRDIDKPVDNVIPLIRVLEAEPAGIPDWAYEQGLVAC